MGEKKKSSFVNGLIGANTTRVEKFRINLAKTA